MTTKQAFKHLTNKRGWYALAGINKDTARSLKRHFKEDKMSESKQSEILKAAGYKLVPAKWTVK